MFAFNVFCFLKNPDFIHLGSHFAIIFCIYRLVVKAFVSFSIFLIQQCIFGLFLFCLIFFLYTYLFTYVLTCYALVYYAHSVICSFVSHLHEGRGCDIGCVGALKMKAWIREVKVWGWCGYGFGINEFTYGNKECLAGKMLLQEVWPLTKGLITEA